jgi:hypothetical protein
MRSCVATSSPHLVCAACGVKWVHNKQSSNLPVRAQCVYSYCMKMHVCARSQMINHMNPPEAVHVLCPPASQHSSTVWLYGVRVRLAIIRPYSPVLRGPVSHRYNSTVPPEVGVWGNKKPGLTSKMRRYMNDCISSILEASAIHPELIASPSRLL